MTHSPRTLVVALCVVLVASCQADTDTDADSSTSTAAERSVPVEESPPTTGPLEDSAGPAVAQVAGVRLGDGRALEADVDPASGRTVVATTVGVVVVDGDAAPVELPAATDDETALLTISPDGRLAAFVRQRDRLLEVWDLDTRTAVSSTPVDPEVITGLVFTPASDAVIVASPSALTSTPVDGGPTTTLLVPTATSELGPPAVSADGAIAVVIGSARPDLRIWSEAGGAREVDLGLPEGTAVAGVRWSPDEQRIAVVYTPVDTVQTAVAVLELEGATIDGTVFLPTLVQPEQVAFQGADRVVIPTLEGLSAYDLAGNVLDTVAPDPPPVVSQITTVPGSSSVVVTDSTGQSTLWAADGTVEELPAPGFSLVDERITTDGGELVTVDFYGTVRRVPLADDGPPVTIDHFAVGEVNSVAFASVDAVAMGTSTGRVQVVSASDGTVERAYDTAEGNVSAVAVNTDESLIATGVSVQERAEAWDDTVTVSSVDTGDASVRFGGEGEDVPGCAFFTSELAFSPDGTLLAASSHDYTVQLSEVDGAGTPDVLEPHLGPVLDVDFSPEGSLLATSSADGSLRIWEVGARTLRDEFQAAVGGYESVAFAPDGTTLAVADLSGQISMVDVASGDVVRTFTGVKGQGGDMEFTPDGAWLITSGEDNTVDVWSVERGAVDRQLTGHTLPVVSVTVARDGSAVASGSLDGTVRYWSLA